MPALSITLRRERWLSRRALFLEMLGYGAVSATALAVDAAILKMLVALAGWHYLPASTVSFIAGAGVAYRLSVRFVFRFHQVKSQTLEFGYFLAIGLIGLLINAAALAIVINGMGLGLLSAKLVAALCTFSANFLLRRTLLFSPSRAS